MITRDHGLESGWGENSPLARLYDARGQILLLGVGHDRNSSLHLAEHRSDWPGKRTFEQGSAMVVDGKRTWVRFQELFSGPDDFTAIGAGFDATTECEAGKVGSATAKLMSQTELVDFGAKWIRENRR